MSDVLIDVRANLGPLQADLQKIPQMVARHGMGKAGTSTAISQKQAAALRILARAELDAAKAANIRLATEQKIVIAGNRTIAVDLKASQITRNRAAAERALADAQMKRARTAQISSPAPAGKGGGGGRGQQGILSAMGGAAKWALAWMAVYRAYNLVIQGFRSGIGTIVEFDFEMVKLHRVLNDTEEAFQKLAVGSVELSTKWGMELSKTMAITVEWAKQGKKAWEVQKLTEATIIASTAAFMDEEKAARFLTATLNAFNMEASRSMEIIDKVNHVSRRYAISSEEMANAIQRSAFSARAAKVNFDELQAMITVISESTRRSGEHIGVALRTLFVKWKKPKVVDVLQDVGIEVVNAEGKFNSFSDVMTQLYIKWDKLTEVEQANIMQKMAGVRRSETFLALMEKFPEVLDVMKTATEAEGSAMDEMAQVMDSTRKRVDLVKTEWTAFWASFVTSDGTQLKSTLDEILERLAEIMRTAGKIKKPINWLQDKIPGEGNIGLRARRMVMGGPMKSTLGKAGEGGKYLYKQAAGAIERYTGKVKTAELNVAALAEAHEKEVQALQKKYGQNRDNLKLLDSNIQKYERFAGESEELQGKAAELIKTDAKVNELMREGLTITEAYTRARKEYGDEQERIAKIPTGAGSKLGAQQLILQGQIGLVGRRESSLKKQITEARKAGKEWGRLEKQWLVAQSVLGKLRKELNEVNEALEDHVVVSKDGEDSAISYTDQLDAVRVAWEGNVDAANAGIAALTAANATAQAETYGYSELTSAADTASTAILGLIAMMDALTDGKAYSEAVALLETVESKRPQRKKRGRGGRRKKETVGTDLLDELVREAEGELFEEMFTIGATEGISADERRRRIQEAIISGGVGLFEEIVSAREGLAKGAGNKKIKVNGKTVDLSTAEGLNALLGSILFGDLGTSAKVSAFPTILESFEAIPAGAERLKELMAVMKEFDDVVGNYELTLASIAKEFDQDVYDMLFLSDKDRIAASRATRRKALDDMEADFQGELFKIHEVAGKLRGFLDENNPALAGLSGMTASAGGLFDPSDIFTLSDQEILKIMDEYQKMLSVIGQMSEEEIEQLNIADDLVKATDIRAQLLDIIKERQGLIKDELVEQRTAVEEQVKSYEKLRDSIRKDFQDPLMSWLTDYEKRWDETIQSIGKNIQKRQLQMAFESTGKLMDKFAGGGLAGTLALGFMPPEKQSIVSGHREGGAFVKRAIIDGHTEGARMFGLGPAATESGGTSGMGMGVGGDFEKAFAQGQTSKGKMAGMSSKILDKINSRMFSQGLGTAMGFGMSIYQGGDVGMAAQNAMPGLGGMAGLYLGGPTGEMIGQGAGLLLSMLTRDLFSDIGKDEKKRRTETTHEEVVVSSQLDLVNRKLAISNRHLAAIKESLDPFARPDSYYFRERVGSGIQNQTHTVKLEIGDEVVGVLAIKALEEGLSVSMMKDLQ